MFNAAFNPQVPKKSGHRKPKPMLYDLQMPSFTPGVYGHLGRKPNTDYHVRLLDYKQKLRDADTQFLAGEAKRMMKDVSTANYDRHVEKSVFKRHIRERYNDKVREVEAALDERRERLRQLLCQEEQDFIALTVKQCQDAATNKVIEMKEKAVQLKARREEERQVIVQRKRIQQYTNDSTDMRPVLFRRNLVESKESQKQQLLEKRMREEGERELNAMWHALVLKQEMAMKDREKEDLIAKERERKAMLETWGKQMEGKRQVQLEAQKVQEEDHIEMVKLAEQVRREEIEALDAKRRKRDKFAVELIEQLAIQEQFCLDRKKEEAKIDAAMDTLSKLEMQREREKIQNTTLLARRESMIYRQYLKELEMERVKEEVALKDLLEVHRKAIQAKQDEAVCKLKRAKEELRRSVMAGREEQIALKRREAEEALRLKEAENELLRMACDTNERLQAEADRLQMEEVKEYREELKLQIEANNEKRRLEREELERELAEGVAEEERRRKLVEEVIYHRLNASLFKHPFGRLLDKGDGRTCPCSRPNQ